MCEGASQQELLGEAELHIIHHGWFLQGVLPPPDRPQGGWVYTVGLLENFGHPELVVTDIGYERGADFLNMLGELIRDGEDLRDLEGMHGLAATRDVHRWHFENDLVNTYIEMYGEIPLTGEYLQVICSAYCGCHRHQVTDLSRAGVVPGGRPLNRAERRAAARQRER